MASARAFPEGLKWIECKQGVGGKKSPICYIPEQDPVQDALKSKKTTYVKLTLPNTRNDSRWQYGCLGLSSSLYCIYALQFMRASRWGLTQGLLKLSKQ